MKKIIQNKLGTYLAVTAGVGCAASVAEGALVVVDLSGLSTGFGTVSLPGGDAEFDIELLNRSNAGYIFTPGLARFYSDGAGVRDNADFGRGYNGGATATFPSDPDFISVWSIGSNTGGGFSVGENWVAFKDTNNRFGWMSFTLRDLGANSTLPITSFGKFVYDDTSTSPANAITLQAAVAAAAIPEPSSLVLLALGATGLAARRQRKKAA